jgi:hypothetical protein
MKGETLVNDIPIGDSTFTRDGIFNFSWHGVNVKVENSPWSGGKTKITTEEIIFKRKRTKVKYIDVGQKPIRVGCRFLGGVVVKRVAPK